MAFTDALHDDLPATIDADVCIVGAGAAGITLALELAGEDLRVLLVESGGFQFRHRPQLLYRGENIGRESCSTAVSRFRRFGGSTTRWAGQCRPLDAIDFEERAAVPHSGWPFGREALDPFYRRAQAIASLGPFDYDPDTWATSANGALPLSGENVETVIYQFSSACDFGERYREELHASANVEVLLNANVVDIEADAREGCVTGLQLATFGGKRARVRARRFVLACGGIENARLLLASKGDFAEGLGNEHDLVGRYFMDHAYFLVGVYEPSKPEYERNFYVIEDYERTGSEQKINAGFVLSEDVRRAEGLNGASIYINRRPRYKSLPEYHAPGARSLVHLVDVLRHAELPDRHLGRHLRNVLGDLGSVGKTLARQAAELWNPQPTQCLRAAIDFAPNAESRVTLGTKKDALGMPRVRVDWRASADDLRGPDRLIAALREEFSSQGLGRLIEDGSRDAEGWPRSATSGKHHMGTTRMHVDPREGVVDADCRVHGLANLYIAGSSVFPTGGYANPTLTIMALAVRLADHLKVPATP